jgi:transcriptional/translational regulatory protein YebC/TACO1
MSGHSKWATTKHKKAVVDAKRGRKPDAVRRRTEGEEDLGPE